MNDFLARTTERLATGRQLNRGSDDPAGLIAAEQLRGDLIDFSAQAKALGAERRQSRVAEVGRQNAINVLHDVRRQVVAASNSSNSPEQQQAIQQQIDASIDAIDRLESSTGFTAPAELQELRSGGAANVVNGDTSRAAEIVTEQVADIAMASAVAGAYEKYTLDAGQRLAESQAIAAATALSKVEDAEFARETSNAIKGQILAEVAVKTSALVQDLQGEQMSLLMESI